MQRPDAHLIIIGHGDFPYTAYTLHGIGGAELCDERNDVVTSRGERAIRYQACRRKRTQGIQICQECSCTVRHRPFAGPALDKCHTFLEYLKLLLEWSLAHSVRPKHR